METGLSMHSLDRHLFYFIITLTIPLLPMGTNTNSNTISGSMQNKSEPMARLAPFKPFVDGQTDPYRLCSHFTTADPHAYDLHKDRLKGMLDPALGTKAVEHLAGTSFKSLMITRRPAEGGYSGVWDEHLAKHPRTTDLARYIATFYDITFIMLNRESPSQEFYLQILAYRNTMLELWLTKGKSFSLRTTLLLTFAPTASP